MNKTFHVERFLPNMTTFRDKTFKERHEVKWSHKDGALVHYSWWPYEKTYQGREDNFLLWAKERAQEMDETRKSVQDMKTKSEAIFLNPNWNDAEEERLNMPIKILSRNLRQQNWTHQKESQKPALPMSPLVKNTDHIFRGSDLSS